MKKLNKYIDHTLLKAQATTSDIISLCADAKKYDFATVCVNPTNIQLAKHELEGTDVGVCTVISFPLGANTIPQKMLEAQSAITLGATEIDFVVNIAKVKEHDWDYIQEEFKAMELVAHENKAKVKVILETCLLTNEEISIASTYAAREGLDFVKTSTGFSTGGATVEAVMLMANAVKGTNTEVKASGGIRTKEDALKMIEAGASRIGTSAGASMIDD